MKWKLLVASILFVVVLIVWFLINQFKREIAISPFQFENEYLDHKFPEEYSTLFKHQLFENSKPYVTTHKSKFTNPVSALHKQKESTLVYKLNVSGDFSSLRGIVKTIQGTTVQSNRVTYRTVEMNNNLKFLYREVFSENIQSITISVENSSEIYKIEKSDSLIIIKIPDERFSIKFGNDSLVNISLQKRGGWNLSNSFSTNLFFVLKNKFVYLIVENLNQHENIDSTSVINILQ